MAVRREPHAKSAVRAVRDQPELRDGSRVVEKRHLYEHVGAEETARAPDADGASSQPPRRRRT